MKTACGLWLLALRSRRAWLAARGVAGLAVAMSAAAGSVAQLLRIEEIAATQACSAPQYRIVWGGDWRPETKGPEQKQPRLLKPLADHWEAAARVQLDSAEAPAPLAPLHPQDYSEPLTLQTATFVCLSFDPPIPPARGPPHLF